MTTDKNAPAHPTPVAVDHVRNYWEGQYHGLTKREYFAALAMQGILANEDIIMKTSITPSEVCSFAVTQADVLIDALNAKDNTENPDNGK